MKCDMYLFITLLCAYYEKNAYSLMVVLCVSGEKVHMGAYVRSMAILVFFCLF